MAKRKLVQLEERDGIVGKECTKCGEWIVLDGFAKNKKGAGGRRQDCRKCAASAAKQYRSENRENIADYNKKWRENNPEYMKIYIKDYDRIQSVEYREKKSNYSRTYYKENREKMNERSQAYYKENREYWKRYRIENHEKVIASSHSYYAGNKEKEKKRVKEWRQKNSERVTLWNQRRRARKSALPVDFNEDQMTKQLDFFKGCALTGVNCQIHWDHVIPLATGNGGTTYGNMIPLRGDLNSSKHDHNLFEWFNANRQRFELSQDKFDTLIEWLSSANDMTVEEYRDYVYWCHDNPRVIEVDGTDNDKEVS